VSPIFRVVAVGAVKGPSVLRRRMRIARKKAASGATRLDIVPSHCLMAVEWEVLCLDAAPWRVQARLRNHPACVSDPRMLLDRYAVPAVSLPVIGFWASAAQRTPAVSTSAGSEAPVRTSRTVS
jgi:hypothetical protein